MQARMAIESYEKFKKHPEPLRRMSSRNCRPWSKPLSENLPGGLRISSTYGFYGYAPAWQCPLRVFHQIQQG